MQVEPASGETAPDAPRGPGAGQLLRDARRERGLSLEQVAESLHLDDQVVEALEAGRFDSIGAPVFVRGHLKAYARVLRIDSAPLLEAYAGVQPPAPSEPLPMRRVPKRGLAINPGPWAMGTAGLLLAVALAVYVLQDGAVPDSAPPLEPTPVEDLDLSNAPTPAAVAPAPAAVLLPPEVSGSAESAAAGQTSPGAGLADSLPPAAPVPDATGAAATAVVPGAPPVAAPEAGARTVPATKLELYFRGESWAEIVDSERRILFGLQREGMRRQLNARLPVQVLLGNAPVVDIYLDGERYEIPPRKVNGNVARFTIEPPAGEPRP